MGGFDIVSHAYVANTALLLESAEQLELGARVLQVVHLDQVDHFGLQRLEALFDLRHTTLAAGGGHLTGQKHLPTYIAALDQLTHHPVSIAVARRGIDHPCATLDEHPQHLEQGSHLVIVELNVMCPRGSQPDHRKHLAGRGNRALA